MEQPRTLTDLILESTRRSGLKPWAGKSAAAWFESLSPEDRVVALVRFRALEPVWGRVKPSMTGTMFGDYLWTVRRRYEQRFGPCDPGELAEHLARHWQQELTRWHRGLHAQARSRRHNLARMNRRRVPDAGLPAHHPEQHASASRPGRVQRIAIALLAAVCAMVPIVSGVTIGL